MLFDLRSLLINMWGYFWIAGIFGTIVGIIILLTKYILKDKISKKCLCILWLIFIFKLTIPFGIGSNFSVFNKIPILNSFDLTFNQFRKKTDDNYSYDDSEIYNIDNLNKYEDLDENKNVKNIDMSKETSDDEFKFDIQKAIQDSNDDEESSYFYLNVIVKIFLILGYLAIYFIFNRKLTSYSQESDRIDEIFKNTLKRMNINKKIKLVITDSVNTPSLIGIFKIKILLPSNLIDLSDSQLEYIFLHELCHYKRKDNILNYVLVILQCIHIFNLVVWFLFTEIRKDIEMACDEKVLSILKEEEHNKYGLTIIDVLEKTNSDKKTIAGLNMVSDKDVVKDRLKMIKKFKNLKNKKVLALTGIISVLILGCVLLTNSVNDLNNKVLEKWFEPDELDQIYANSLLKQKIDYTEDEYDIGYLLHNIDSVYDHEYNYELTLSSDLYYINSIKFVDEKKHDSILVNYDMRYNNLSDIENTLYKNSAIIFSLVKSLKEINYNINIGDVNQYKFNFKREDIESKLNIKLSEIEDDKYYEFLIDLSMNTEGESSLNEAIEKYLYKKSSLILGDTFFDNRETVAENSGWEASYEEYAEFETTSYAIIGKNEDDKKVTVYLLYDIGKFSFRGDKFILDYSEIVPVKVSFSKNKKGQFCFMEEVYINDYGDLLLSRPRASVFEEGSIEYLKEYINQIFPKEETYKAMYGDYENKLGMELMKNANEYLESINSDAEIGLIDNFEVEFNISEAAIEKLYNISLIKSYFYDKGSYKSIEDNKICIYESKQEGNNLIFTKYNETREEILERIKIKVDGDDLIILEQ